LIFIVSLPVSLNEASLKLGGELNMPNTLLENAYPSVGIRKKFLSSLPFELVSWKMAIA
jgi:hypothetical protein